MRSAPVLFALALTIACSACALLTGKASVFSSKQVGNTLEISLSGEAFTTLHFADEPKPFLYPVFGPGAVPMTRSFPMETRLGEEQDHPHHVSLWFAHGEVNGHDFWHSPDARQLLRGEPEISRDAGSLTVELEYVWTATDGEVLHENRALTFGEDGAARFIDFSTELVGTTGAVLFGDTKEGTFAIRMHPQLRLQGPVAGGQVLNSEGVRGKQVWGQRARWIVYYGSVEDQEVGVAMFDHPKNLRHPTWWHARDYGLCAANPFGLHHFEKAAAGTGNLTLREGQRLRLRYRVYLFSGAMTAEAIDAAYQRYAASGSVE